MNKKDLVVGEHYAIGDGQGYRRELMWCEIEIMKFDATFPCESGYQAGHIFPKKGTLVKLHPHEGRDHISAHYMKTYKVANQDESLYVMTNARCVQRKWDRHVEIITEKAKEVRAAENDLQRRQDIAVSVISELTDGQNVTVGEAWDKETDVNYFENKAEFHMSAEVLAKLLGLDV